MSETVWVDPAAIRSKIAPCLDLNGIMAGDWDIQRRRDLTATAKHRAIVQRFTQGRRWEDTELFRDLYKRRFKHGRSVRGATSLEALAAQYYDRVDGLYHSMKRDGFLLETAEGKPLPLPGFLVGRHGEIFIGNQGNHRLAIAQVIGLDRIAGRITCRYS